MDLSKIISFLRHLGNFPSTWEISKVRKYTKLSWQLMDDIPIFYTLEKATDSTDYLTDAHYHRVHYIRSLMWSWVTTTYEIHNILKIEKVIDAVDVIRLMKMDCRL